MPTCIGAVRRPLCPRWLPVGVVAGQATGERGAKRSLVGLLLRTLLWSGLLLTPRVDGQDLPEYRIKAGFVYNFMVYAEWPAETGDTLNLCIYGADPFGKEIDVLQGRVIADRRIAVHRKAEGESLTACQAVFISSSAMPALSGILESLRDQPVLTMADGPGAMRKGVMLNMAVVQSKVSFDANLRAARRAGIALSSRLLRLATEVLR